MTIVAQVPEPSTIVLLGLVVVAFVAIGWLRARRPAPRTPKKGS